MKTIDKLLSEKMMTLVRCNSQKEGQEMADALVDAGVKIIEITLTTPGALKIIEKLLKPNQFQTLQPQYLCLF